MLAESSKAGGGRGGVCVKRIRCMAKRRGGRQVERLCFVSAIKRTDCFGVNVDEVNPKRRQIWFLRFSLVGPLLFSFFFFGCKRCVKK